MTNQSDDDGLFDDDDELTAEARVKLAQFGSDKGVSDVVGPGSVEEYSEMDAETVIALSEAAQGNPVAPPTGYDRRTWASFLESHGVTQ